MKKSIKQLLSGAIISAVTLAFGFALTMLSFNLFDSLTANQMKILFAADIICLALTGCIAFFLFESKRSKKRKEKLLQERHNRRIEKRNNEIKGLESILNKYDLVA